MMGDRALPQILNVASMNIAIGDLGQQIAEHYNAKLEIGLNTPTYSFRMDTSKAIALTGPSDVVVLSQRCEEFRNEVAPSVTSI